MKKISVNTGDRYDILIENGILDRAGEIIAGLKQPCKVLLVTDSNVEQLYLKRAVDSLKKAGFETFSFSLPAGEEYKTLSNVEWILRAAANKGLSRGDLFVALGGGVVGDMCGFAASIYMRGLPFVQIPSTLLSDIDSSVGGKTGCDLPQGKNLAGTFLQPLGVIIDPELLRSLAPRVFNDGVAEAIKYGFIASPELLDILESGVTDQNICEIIYKCCDIKRRYVEADEKENGVRRELNFGHTIGHAVEKYYNYKTYTHGEAVAIGMAAALSASEKLFGADPSLKARLVEMLKKYSLPVKCEADIKELAAICAHDKKRRGDFIDIVLIKQLGEAGIYRAPLDGLSGIFGGETV